MYVCIIDILQKVKTTFTTIVACPRFRKKVMRTRRVDYSSNNIMVLYFRLQWIAEPKSAGQHQGLLPPLSVSLRQRSLFFFATVPSRQSNHRMKTNSPRQYSRTQEKTWGEINPPTFPASRLPTGTVKPGSIDIILLPMVR